MIKKILKNKLNHIQSQSSLGFTHSRVLEEPKPKEKIKQVICSFNEDDDIIIKTEDIELDKPKIMAIYNV